MEQADLAAAQATTLLVIGLVVLVAVRIVEGFYANLAYEKRYLEWRGNPLVASGLDWKNAIFGTVLWLGIVPLTLYRFTVKGDPAGAIIAQASGARATSSCSEPGVEHHVRDAARIGVAQGREPGPDELPDRALISHRVAAAIPAGARRGGSPGRFSRGCEPHGLQSKGFRGHVPARRESPGRPRYG